MHKLIELVKQLEPLKVKRNPAIAFVLGFAFGPVGLGIYFKSWMDAFVALALWFVFLVLLGVPSGEILGVLGPTFSGLYGLHRARTSNERIR
jgi:hypothetical protein